MAQKMIVDLERCIGCWTCSMACKMGWDLEDDAYRVIVRTLGSGAGIDRPQGVYPDLRMTWQPVFNQDCTLCAPRVAEGQQPYCVHNCPTKALSFGEAEDDSSDYNVAKKRCSDMKYRLFSMPEYERGKTQITYATRT